MMVIKMSRYARHDKPWLIPNSGKKRTAKPAKCAKPTNFLAFGTQKTLKILRSALPQAVRTNFGLVEKSGNSFLGWLRPKICRTEASSTWNKAGAGRRISRPDRRELRPSGILIRPGGRKVGRGGRKVGPGGRSQLAGNFPDSPPPTFAKIMRSASPKFDWGTSNLGEALAPEGKGVFLRQSAAPSPIFRF
jgi:hypothetical protein